MLSAAGEQTRAAWGSTTTSETAIGIFLPLTKTRSAEDTARIALAPEQPVAVPGAYRRRLLSTVP